MRTIITKYNKDRALLVCLSLGTEREVAVPPFQAEEGSKQVKTHRSHVL